MNGMSLLKANIEEIMELVNKQRTINHIIIDNFDINLKNKLNFGNNNFIQFMIRFKLELSTPIDIPT